MNREFPNYAIQFYLFFCCFRWDSANGFEAYWFGPALAVSLWVKGHGFTFGIGKFDTQ